MGEVVDDFNSTSPSQVAAKRSTSGVAGRAFSEQGGVGLAEISGAGYDAAMASSSSAAASSRLQLRLIVNGHVEAGGHTMYVVECWMQARGTVQPLTWHVQRRLKQFQD